MAAARKARKANFSNCEDVAIIESYRKQKHVLQSKFKSTVTNRKKQTAWTEVTNAVNSVSAVCRTTKEVKERWVKLTKKAKAQLRARKYPPTSSGKNDEMANLDVMADILLGESDLTDGIAEGGIDAGDTQPKSGRYMNYIRIQSIYGYGDYHFHLLFRGHMHVHKHTNSMHEEIYLVHKFCHLFVLTN